LERYDKNAFSLILQITWSKALSSRKPTKKNKEDKKSQQKDFDKYWYYKASVQSPDTDAEFNFKTYERLRGKQPRTFTEDFCGTFAISCEMSKYNDNVSIIGVDLDPEPINYGRENYYTQLTPAQQKRINIIEANVLDKDLPKTDMICAQNFSYMIFKERNLLKEYFQNAYNRLENDGIFVVDCFGGSDCQEANEHETEHDKFSYYWDQDGFNPINHHAMFYIHFKRKGEKRREKVFTYDWRLWTIPEIRDLMTDVGFKRTEVLWEGTDDDGEGNGEFTPTEMGEECESWVAYIVGMK